MDNSQFLTVLKKSFLIYLRAGARSNKKLEGLHGAISQDVQERLNDNSYSIHSLGYRNGKEYRINGRYINKMVDITVDDNCRPLAGIAVKYVMSNYSQNSNNYFENMLGETANIRSAQIPYFQIFIIPDKVPYFDKYGTISKWENINEHHLKKYIKLSDDNVDIFLHTPNKTLLFIVHIASDYSENHIYDRQDYVEFYLHNDFSMEIADLNFDFGNSVIYNDYDKFIQKVVYAIKSL